MIFEIKESVGEEKEKETNERLTLTLNYITTATHLPITRRRQGDQRLLKDGLCVGESERSTKIKQPTVRPKGDLNAVNMIRLDMDGTQKANRTTLISVCETKSCIIDLSFDCTHY